MTRAELYVSRLDEIRAKIDFKKKARLKPVLNWLSKKRESTKALASIVPIGRLSDWVYDQEKGLLRHKRGTNCFFYVQGVSVKNSYGTEVSQWNQPIIVQKGGGVLAILCQERESDIRFLLHARYEPGNIRKLQLAPTVQATISNLKGRIGDYKPRFAEYINNRNQVIYAAKHNEEGARFWRKSNMNMLILLDPKEEVSLSDNDNYIWLSLPQIKALMLFDNIINPYVKTILSPL